MMKSIQIVGVSVFLLGGFSACTTAKLEARLEANPQCKDVYNAKTGALMPCPGSDKSFYVAAGLEPPKQAKQPIAPNASAEQTSSAVPSSNTVAVTQPASNPLVNQTPATTKSVVAPSSAVAQPECKPTIHKKTGGMLPCPPQD